ncbi:hypothetical protein [Streptomyces sp. 900105245]
MKLLVGLVFLTRCLFTGGFMLVTHAAVLDVPRHVVEMLAKLLGARRRRIGTPKKSRALGLFRQAVLLLRWFRDRSCVHCLARDAGISQATGYRYLHEGMSDHSSSETIHGRDSLFPRKDQRATEPTVT